MEKIFYNQVLIPFIAFDKSRESVIASMQRAREIQLAGEEPDIGSLMHSLFVNHMILFFEPTNGSKLPQNLFGLSDITISVFESYLRTMISNSALKLFIPYLGAIGWERMKKPKHIKKLFSPSIQKRIDFVDESERIWKAIRLYFSEIGTDVQEWLPAEIPWNLYMLTLGCKYSSEVLLSTENTLSLLKTIKGNPKLTNEGRTRLSVVEGIFSSFREKHEGSFLKFYPLSDRTYIAERIDEIIEDAHFLQSSKLRRMLSFEANIVSIQRDLRLLIKTICSTRKWAKGVMTIGKYAFSSGSPVLDALEQISEKIVGLRGNVSSPVIIHANPSLFGEGTTGYTFLYRNISGGYDAPHYTKGWDGKPLYRFKVERKSNE